MLNLNVRLGPCLVNNYRNRSLNSQYASMARKLKVKGDVREFLIDSNSSDGIEGVDDGNLRVQTTPQATNLVNRYQCGQRPADASWKYLLGYSPAGALSILICGIDE